MPRSSRPPKRDKRSNTWPNNTAQFPLWVNMARELAGRLSALPGEEVTVQRLLAYANTFERWGDALMRPPSDERAPVIREYMGVYRHALSVMAEHPELVAKGSKSHDPNRSGSK